MFFYLPGFTNNPSATDSRDLENDFWVKFTKNWGKLKEGAKYHGQAISGGYDRKLGENEFANGWILGGDIAFPKGRHDRDLSASVMLRKLW